MSRRLLVHMHVPKTGGRSLDAQVFERVVPVGARLRLDDLDRARAIRAGGGASDLDGIRFVSGRLPFGAFDGAGIRATYVALFRDPEERLMALIEDLVNEACAGLRCGEVGCSWTRLADPAAAVGELLACEEARRTQFNVMTRLAAGMPLDAPVETDAVHLVAARANLSRTNCLLGLSDRMDLFVAYLRDVFGWAVSVPAAAGPQAPACRAEDLPRGVRDRLRAAMDLDLRLFDEVAERRLLACA